jgi:hypothetical protein
MALPPVHSHSSWIPLTSSAEPNTKNSKCEAPRLKDTDVDRKYENAITDM